MRPHIVHETVTLGDLVVAAFDEAALYSANPREVSSLATQAVAHILSQWPRQGSRQRRWQGPTLAKSPRALFTSRRSVQ